MREWPWQYLGEGGPGSRHRSLKAAAGPMSKAQNGGWGAGGISGEVVRGWGEGAGKVGSFRWLLVWV